MGMLGHDIGTVYCGRMATSPRNVWNSRIHVLSEGEIEVHSTATCMEIVMNLPTERVFCPNLRTIASGSFSRSTSGAYDLLSLSKAFSTPCLSLQTLNPLAFFHIPDVHILSLNDVLSQIGEIAH